MSSTKPDNVLRMPLRSESALGARATDAIGEAESVESVFGTPFRGEATFIQSENPERAEEAPEAEAETSANGFVYIAVDRIRYSPFQTRVLDGEAELEELARSIEARGILQPILVRPCSDEESVWEYELIAGERRLRAARLVGLAFIPALVQDLDDVDAAQISIIENAQRENLNPIEEAQAFARLQSEFGLNQTEIAQAIGKNRATISNALRLLQLDERVIEMLREKQLSAGHGRVLLRVDEPQAQFRLAKKAVEQEISVHALEAKVSRLQETLEDEEEELSDEELRALKTLERQRSKVSDLLGLEEVNLRYDAQGNKRLNLVFETEASWKRFMAKLRD